MSEVRRSRFGWVKQATKDMVGKTYGLLTVKAVFMVPGKRGAHAECECACGKTKIAKALDVRQGHTKSCGCKHWPRGTAHHRYKNGSRGNPTYRSWSLMKRRCYNVRSEHYAGYGGRGIIVCPSWQNSFASFLHDMGDRPHGMEIDRIDNNGPYCPFNCRWADRVTQTNNTRRNVYLKHNGVTMSISQWERSLGLPPSCVSQRINKLGWSAERALTTPRRISR